METSIIIRTKNEEKWIGECLTRLSKQTYKNFDIIVVDSGSTDKTLDILKKFDVKVYSIKPEEFSYPYALNFGCSKSTAEKYFIFLSAHSLPCSSTWISDGLENLTDEKTMGVYGPVYALPDGSIWEKIWFNRFKVWLRRLFNKKIFILKDKVGVMGNTNAIIKRKLWDEHHFSESYGLGGEDGEWARYWFDRGYFAIKLWRFAVAHSHGLGLFALKKQRKYWHSLSTPQPFNKLNFRK